MIVAVTALVGARGQNKELTKIGAESKKVNPDMLLNAQYLGALDGVDMWLTKSEDGVKGLANKRDWHVVKLSDALIPIERADLPKTHQCELLGAACYQQNALVLLVDSSASGRTTIFGARVSTDSLRLAEGRLDTVDHYTYGRKDRCKVWSAVSPNGRYFAVLTRVLHKAKDTVYVTKVLDENLNEVWSKDFNFGYPEVVYVDDNGKVYAMETERIQDGMTFKMTLIDRSGADSYSNEKKCDPVQDLQIVNVIGKKVLCTGLYKSAAAKPKEDVTSGVVTMVFDVDSMSLTKFNIRPYENDDKNIILNEHTIRDQQRVRDLPMMTPLGSLRMPYGALLAVGHHHSLRYVNANGSVTNTFNGMGVILLAIDMNGNVKWVRHIRRNDISGLSDATIALHMFADGETAYVVKNETPKAPALYDIAKKAREYEVGDKSNLVLYGISASGEVTKSILEKNTKQVMANIGSRKDGSCAVLTFRGSKCRMAVLETK